MDTGLKGGAVARSSPMRRGLKLVWHIVAMRFKKGDIYKANIKKGENPKGKG